VAAAAAGGVVQHLRSRLARQGAERWLVSLLASRGGRAELAATTTARRFIDHVDADGRPLSSRVAAAELLNVLRPTVAVAVLVVFAAHALHTRPEWRARLRERTDGGELGAFVEEARRFYPFFPSVVARSRHDFEWNDHRVPGLAHRRQALAGVAA
jgi:fatty-acid peroxygenase